MKHFIDEYFHRFNAATVKHAAKAWVELDKKGGKMFLAMAGAMSSGRMGKVVTELIRAGKIAAISVTGANLEESVFDLFGRDKYIDFFNYKELTKQDEMKIRSEGNNRVTDLLIPDEVMEDVYELLRPIFLAAQKKKEQLFPAEIFYRLFAQKGIEKEFVVDPSECWLYAAWQHNIPVFTPGFADSSTANMIVADHLMGKGVKSSVVKNDFDQMEKLAEWYRNRKKPTGFFQIGGGIAGDFPICVVPLLIQEMKQKVPLWAYFAQISDSTTSFGSYSGAHPSEKITWEKLSDKTPMFAIESDASIVFPLIAHYVLEG